MVKELNMNDYQKLLDEGQSYSDKGDYKEAIKIYKTALVVYKKIDSITLASLYIRIANAYYSLDDKDKATYYYEQYLKEYPTGQVSVFSRLAHAYFYLDTDKSIDYHNKGLNMEVNQYDAACKLFAMTKSAYYDQQDIKEESEYEADLVKNNLYKNIKKYKHDDKKSDKNKKLNIGYLSSDCHAHTMMNYILPIWKHHNKNEFNFYIFNCSSKDDATTEQIKKTGIEMFNCSKMEVPELAKFIYEKNIDILIDLSGYTHLKSFVSFYKPAPIIMSYLGYLNTLGIKEVDYIIADKFTIPEDKAYLYTEKPLYLDKGYHIFTEKNLPDIEECPFIKNNYVTFGSFNCTSKFNDTVIYMWSKLLESVPDSKLLIYRTQLTKSIIQYLRTKFSQRGVDTDRIIFSSKSLNPHYKAYSLADIALDPYPFSGMSIAMETMMMGVPTITMCGDGIQSRSAARINHVLGFDEMNSNSGEEYIENAVSLANNKEKLKELRNTLRNKINSSEIIQGAEEFTRDLENKYKKAWEDFINSP